MSVSLLCKLSIIEIHVIFLFLLQPNFVCNLRVQIFCSTFSVPLYIPHIKTCHVLTYLIKLVIFCISLFQLLKINIKKEKKKKKHPRPNNRFPLQPPLVHHHQSSPAELTRGLWRCQRSYPLPADHTTSSLSTSNL